MLTLLWCTALFAVLLLKAGVALSRLCAALPRSNADFDCAQL
ncbi:MAG TPA: hypothetical protein VE029_01980 [Rhizobacter sp.]|nr:hypothetical protein [Rhizobacter sp.]